MLHAILPKLPAPVRRIVEKEENLLAVGFAWLLAPPLCALTGFYLGTIIGAAHVIDLQPYDLQRALIGAGIGLLVGVIIAVLTTVLYPAATEADAREGAARDLHEDVTGNLSTLP